jgi:mRNA-degrading endonuclease RelE of RelBE toxin-antitoxin system
MAWKVSVAKPAQKSVAKFPAKDRAKIGTAIVAMADDPFAGDVIKLEGIAGRWRCRIGSYRIFFAVDASAKTVKIIAIVR